MPSNNLSDVRVSSRTEHTHGRYDEQAGCHSHKLISVP